MFHVAFFLFLLLLATLGMQYILARLISQTLALAKPARRRLAWIMAGVYLLAVTGLVSARRLPEFLPGYFFWLDWLGGIWLGSLLIACVCALTAWFLQTLILRLGYGYFDPKQGVTDATEVPEALEVPGVSARREWLKRSLGAGALLVATAASARALHNGLADVEVQTQEIVLPRLPLALDGFRIVQLSDLHIGVADTAPKAAWLEKIVATVNRLDADLIAITGDLVDGSVVRLSGEVAALRSLRSRLGTCFVTGNHEYYSGAEAWCAHLSGMGIAVLRNRHITLFAGSEKAIDIAGVDDYRSARFGGRHDLAAALAGRDPQRPVILLAHQPISVHLAAQHGVDLQLSGHTHGGQIWPFGYMVLLEQPYIAGLHRYPGSQTQIYVNRGTGYWGPPMRLAVAAEITCITLRSGA